MNASSEPREEAVKKYFRKTPEKPEVGNSKALMIIGGILIVVVLLFWIGVAVFGIAGSLFGDMSSAVQSLAALWSWGLTCVV